LPCCSRRSQRATSDLAREPHEGAIPMTMTYTRSSPTPEMIGADLNRTARATGLFHLAFFITGILGSRAGPGCDACAGAAAVGASQGDGPAVSGTHAHSVRPARPAGPVPRKRTPSTGGVAPSDGWQMTDASTPRGWRRDSVPDWPQADPSTRQRTLLAIWGSHASGDLGMTSREPHVCVERAAVLEPQQP
jgi:hypothetical protein